MTTKTLDIVPIIERMIKNGIICSAAAEHIYERFGEHPKITPANLRKAAGHRALHFYRMFCAEWLGWPDELVLYLNELENRMVWRPSRHAPHSHFTDRHRRCQEAHVAATLAWIQEMRKP